MSQSKYVNFYDFLKSQNSEYEIPLALEEETQTPVDNESNTTE